MVVVVATNTLVTAAGGGASSAVGAAVEACSIEQRVLEPRTKNPLRDLIAGSRSCAGGLLSSLHI